MLWAWRPRRRVTDATASEALELRERHQGEGEAGRAVGAAPARRSTAATGLDFLEHAYMNEVLAYAIGAASLFGVVAPNSRQPVDPREVRHRGAEAEVADPAHRGDDGVGLLDDRARQRRAPTRARSRPRARPRRRRVGDQRPQVVHVERHARRLLHRHVPHRGPGRRRRPQRHDDADHRAHATRRA